MRAHELAVLALELERSAPGDALKVWLHVACLDPERDDAPEGAVRTALVRIHAPEVMREEPDVASQAPDLASAFTQLDNPILVAPPKRLAEVTPRRATPPRAKKRGVAQQARPSPHAAPQGVPSLADGLLDEAEGLVRQAHFEEALETARKAREAVPETGDQAALRKRRARADVIAGTAQVALGQDAEARASFERAIQTDPSLRLDRANTSPKVLRAFEAARGGAP